MAKYKLKSLSVQINGIIYRKKNEYIFDTDGKDKGIKREIEESLKADFLEKLSKKEAAEKEAAKKEAAEKEAAEKEAAKKEAKGKK